MKKVIIVALVMLVVVTGIPLPMAMGMMTCDQCPGALAMSGGWCALAAITATAIIVGIGRRGRRLRSVDEQRNDLLIVYLIERPPRFA